MLMETESVRLIKKYPNRRLYDTFLRAYITLNDIKNLIYEKIRFKVIDARTQKDLTQNTLLLIIAEQEIHTTPIFSNSLLENFIRLYHDKSQLFLRQFLEESLQLFMQQREIAKNL